MRSRFFRVAVSLLVVCCILFNCSPLPAKATGMEVALIGVTAATAVASIMIGLGIMPGPDISVFEDMVNDCVEDLTIEGIVVDGMISSLRLLMDWHEVFYGVPEDVVGSVRDWAFMEGFFSVEERSIYSSAGFTYAGSNASANLYWNTVDIFSLFNSGSSWDSLLTSLYSAHYACLTLTTAQTLNLYSVPSLTPYTNLDYPMGTLQRFSSTKLVDSSATLSTSTSTTGSLYINYGAALEKWQATGNVVFFLTSDSRLRFDDVKFERIRHWFDNVG